MKAHERQVSHHQAGSMADAAEIAHTAPGDAGSPAERFQEAAEFASTEIRAALNMTRRAADNRLSWAMDLRERLPHVWEMLDQGVLDLGLRSSSEACLI
jgi:protein involved in temperature-dependent protein secretion